MEWSIEMFLQELKSALEWAELYMTGEGGNFCLLNAGEKTNSAWQWLCIAKKYLEEKELEEWNAIYWDFYRDLLDYIEK